MNENQNQSTYERTLAGYANGFRVSHIATFGLSFCSPQEETSKVWVKFPDFDQVPVQDNQRTIGILERRRATDSLDLLQKSVNF